jgi:ADP-heptose:LPS heptosyltransferase
VRPKPKRILLILPCCIGDVVMATAALMALRRAYPDAWIGWAVGKWSRPALEGHPALDAVIDAGDSASPVHSPRDLLRFARVLRAARADWIIALVRSPLMSLAVWLSGCRVRAGLDSGGRGFGYSVRVTVDPDQPDHEARLYLDVVAALGVNAEGMYPFIPVHDADRASVRALLTAHHIGAPYFVVNPAGGRNPGMTLDAKRYPPDLLAPLVGRLSVRLDAAPVLIGAADDSPLIEAVNAHLARPAESFAGALSFGQIAALAADSRLYLGNDTGLTHLAAAAGAPTAMILGPTDPRRYAPYNPNAVALWKPADLPARGVAAGAPQDWDWRRDGISVDDAERRILSFLGVSPGAN